MPDFASKAYWEERFTADKKPFDWLIPATALRDVITDVSDTKTLRNCEILHVGCGTSESAILRELVGNPQQIFNVDYSEAAIGAAAEREQELLTEEQNSDHPLETEESQDAVQRPIPLRGMRWSCMDLLSLDSTLSLLERQLDESGKLFDLVLDKSTSDSISIGQDVPLNVPYPLSINGWTRRILQSGTDDATANVHPLHVLAVHLAALTTPGSGRWIAISYSEDRFPFLPPFPRTVETGLLGDDIIKKGFTHPHQLWKLEKKEKVDLDAIREETLAERKKRLSAGPIHRPKVTHWLYVLRRTSAMVMD